MIIEWLSSKITNRPIYIKQVAGFHLDPYIRTLIAEKWENISSTKKFSVFLIYKEQVFIRKQLMRICGDMIMYPI